MYGCSVLNPRGFTIIHVDFKQIHVDFVKSLWIMLEIHVDSQVVIFYPRGWFQNYYLSICTEIIVDFIKSTCIRTEKSLLRIHGDFIKIHVDYGEILRIRFFTQNHQFAG